jgi:hypothetical protein
MPPGNSPAATRRCRPMMSWSLDVRTVILLLFFGNLVTVGILSAYTRDQGAARPYRLFLISKLIQAAAWALLGLRGEIFRPAVGADRQYPAVHRFFSRSGGLREPVQAGSAPGDALRHLGRGRQRRLLGVRQYAQPACGDRLADHHRPVRHRRCGHTAQPWDLAGAAGDREFVCPALPGCWCSEPAAPCPDLQKQA